MPKVTSKDGSIIAYDKRGQGPLLILVLGALNKRGSGKKLAGNLEDKFTVVSYDRRGRGDSTEESTYSVNKEVQDIEALIDANGGKAFLYGHSSGAILALLASKSLSSEVVSAALYELPYNSKPEDKEAAESYRKELKQLLNSDKHAEAVALFIKSVGVSDKQIAALKKLPMWKGLVAMAHTLAYDTIDLMEEYPKMDVKAIKTKTLVMNGGSSSEFMRQTAQELAKLLPNGEYKELEGQQHDVKAEVLAPVLIRFFN